MFSMQSGPIVHILLFIEVQCIHFIRNHKITILIHNK